MSRRRLAVALAVAALAVAALLVATLPPRPLVASLPAAAAPAVAGAFHVHTNRSDGTGTPEEVAAAAARAGLQFVMLADHGDGTREPMPAAYLHGVLIIDGVEISTSAGHYVAVGMRKAPYPLAGDPAAVVADVSRLGGFGVVAHPGSAKDELRWEDWDIPFDGVEWLNADSEWRDEPVGSLVTALFHYPFRAREAVAGLFDRPEAVLAAWDRAALRRRVVAVAGADAHARLGTGRGDPGENRFFVRLPAYETVFQAFSVRAELDTPLSGDAAADAERVIGALRQGRVYTAIDALAAPTSFAFTATGHGETVPMGARLAAGRLTFRVEAAVPFGAETLLVHNGRVIRRVGGGHLFHEAEVVDGVYRPEIHLPSAPGDPPVPWIVGNPIYVGPAVRGDGHATEGREHQVTPLSLDGWALEHDSESQGVVVPFGGAAEWRASLGPRRDGWVALAHGIAGGLADVDRLAFRGRASRPLRVFLQVRAPGARGDRRWQHSIYLDDTPRDISVRVRDLEGVGEAERDQPVDVAAVDSVLFVLNTVNTAPGTNASIWLDGVRLEGDRPAP